MLCHSVRTVHGTVKIGQYRAVPGSTGSTNVADFEMMRSVQISFSNHILLAHTKKIDADSKTAQSNLSTTGKVLAQK